LFGVFGEDGVYRIGIRLEILKHRSPVRVGIRQLCAVQVPPRF
jgi:hypothetical protein